MRLFTFCVSLVSVLAGFRPCSEPTLFTPMLLHASPEQVKYGTNMSFFVYFGFQNESVKNGVLDIQTTTYGTTVYHHSFQLCEFFQCPLQPGNHTWTRTFTWPTSIAGTYKSTLQLKNTSTTFLCLEHDLVIPWF